MFKKIGVSAKLSSNAKEIDEAERLILPGVGAYDKGMQTLNSSGLRELLDKKALEDKIPILGICLGMQLMMESSEEGTEPGLGWIKGHLKKFSFNQQNTLLQEGKNSLKVPHMGWNTVMPKSREGLYKNFPEELRFYFVHSYYATCSEPSEALASTYHGHEFTSSIQKGNIYGAQFHPEKSHKFGMQLLKNFSKL